MRRRSRAGRFGAAVAVGVLLLGGAPVAAATQGAVPQRYLDQQITWQPCFPPGEVPDGFPPGSERLECGSYRAPRNWNRPDDKIDITVAVSRLRPEHGEPKGTVLTNPGGPGVPGWLTPVIFLGAGRTKLVENMEIVGIDVRGTGASTNVGCRGRSYPIDLDPRDRDPGNVELIYDSMALLAKSCQVTSGEFGRYVNTEQTARDLDLLRHVLGRDKVHWIGYSGGSWLGAHFATYFPDRMGRVMLDSNTEFTATYQKVFSQFGMGAQRRFDVDFAPWVARYDSTYQLGTTGEQVRRNYEYVRAKLAENPVVLPDGTEMTPMQFDYLLFQAQYARVQFPRVAAQFATLRRAVDQPPDRPVSVHLNVPFPDDASNATLYSTLCNDTEFTGNRRWLAKEAERLGSKYPLVGWYQLGAPCAFWDRPALQLKRPTGEGVPPVLMVQSVRDPATPIEGARRAHARFAGSRMLTVTESGEHGVYASGNPCVDAIVESYVVDGKVPERDLSCPGMPLPEPDARAARTATPNPILDNLRLINIVQSGR